MKPAHYPVLFLMTLSLSGALMAQEGGVAKVIILRGQVKAKLIDGNILDVKVDQSIPEGAVLQTAEKSFVKLIFIDKSQMNLGPSSQMVINAFPKKEAGIITLVKGQIRSQVTKDYMEMDDKSKSKLYIKTKTAAMGIRGTDFQVNFNPENQNTSLITFEGKVAMAHIDRAARNESFDQHRLETVVSSKQAVMVEHGQISAVNLNVAERAMSPTLLGTKQIEALKENETGVKESSDTDKKQYRNPLPPGADSASFSNVPQTVAKTIDTSAKVDPNGFFNTKTGEYKLPAGSIIDLKTVNIIPPPVNAVFDPVTKTYVVPESFGKIDKTTGEYKPPQGLALGHDGKFVLVDAEAYAKTQAVNKEEKKEEKAEDKKEEKKEDKKEDKKEEKKEEKKDDKADDKGDKGKGGEIASKEEPKKGDGRAPASEAPAAVAAAPIVKLPDVIALPTGWRPPMDEMRPVTSSTITDAQRALAQERISTTETVKQTTTTVNPNTKVNFKFNVQ